MEHSEDSVAAPRTGIATYVVDAIVALVLLAIGIVVIVESRRLGAGWTSDGPGSGYFPFWIGVVVVVSALGILYQALFGKNRNTEVFVDPVQLKRVMSVLVPATVYVLAVTFLGLYVASAIYIALFMIFLGNYSPLKSTLVAVAVNVVFFLMFEVWFKVPLFKGSLDPLRFLGY
ncbi:tripartite tricarboxylate transporter TctB family protein [Variovorax sp. J22R24]|uniref:tripartite tricarboxylate transporter TctB family protein n=1 Tax=Variovorax gracilis TaxID=3053502 RepID=UPI002576D6D9|nr:tripartite tricarboxylate transporter TctB family protein [Variovorax sp. J22R24]MDM0105384.1 tripartite tricarboxylate transporter TctB family protein [Variovorax sp. J22R24]